MTKKILIVDDDLYIRELYEEVLKDEKYNVETAVNGVEALDKMDKIEFDLVLLDVMMPKLDGLGVLDKVQAGKVNHKPKNIMLLTNLSHDPIIEEAEAKGANTFLIKADLTPDQLVEEVKKQLS